MQSTSGNLLLIEVATRLTACVREADTVARFGGDEFVVLLDELDKDEEVSREMAMAAAEKIRATLAETYSLMLNQEDKPEVAYDCTPSIGVAMFTGMEANMDEILKCADIAMYRAKESGRNTIRFYDDGI